jgi:hypothetical protein
MRKTLIAMTLAALAVTAHTAPALAQSAAATHYSVVDTLVGKMLDDPTAAAILKELIPTVYANDMFQSAGRDLTLKGIQQYEPEALSDENLAKIQAALNKIPAKN